MTTEEPTITDRAPIIMAGGQDIRIMSSIEGGRIIVEVHQVWHNGDKYVFKSQIWRSDEGDIPKLKTVICKLLQGVLEDV